MHDFLEKLDKYFFQFIFAVCGLGLGFAVFMQYVVGLHPCPLCLYQRWPYVIGFVVAAVGWRRVGLRPLVLIELIIVFSVNVFLGLYHVGIENGWWEGFTTCSAEGAATMEELINQIMAAPVVRCDEVQWSLMGLSLAALSMLLSAGLVGLCVWKMKNDKR